MRSLKKLVFSWLLFLISFRVFRGILGQEEMWATISLYWAALTAKNMIDMFDK